MQPQSRCPRPLPTAVAAKRAGHVHRERFAGWHEPIPAALDHYDALRLARTAMLVRRSRSIARLAHLQEPLRCTLCDRVVAAAGPFIRNRALDELLGWYPSG
jgi:2-polyprenyl-6-methoxyphenol hydroxylase-like FAD-dependent oxidoreductase